MRRESSSRNDQLDAPLIAVASYQSRLHPADDRLGSATQHRLSFPRQIIAEQPDGFDLILSGEKAQRRQTAEGARAEQVATMIGEPPLRQEPAGGQPECDAAGKNQSA